MDKHDKKRLSEIVRKLADGIEGDEMPERVNDINGNGECVVEYQTESGVLSE